MPYQDDVSYQRGRADTLEKENLRLRHEVERLHRLLTELTQAVESFMARVKREQEYRGPG